MGDRRSTIGMEQRFVLKDWVEGLNIKEMTIQQLVSGGSAAIGTPITKDVIKGVIKAAGLEWNPIGSRGYYKNGKEGMREELSRVASEMDGLRRDLSRHAEVIEDLLSEMSSVKQLFQEIEINDCSSAPKPELSN